MKRKYNPSKCTPAVIVNNIHWDTGHEPSDYLPSSVVIAVSKLMATTGISDPSDDDLFDAVADYLSDKYGFCVFAFNASIKLWRYNMPKVHTKEAQMKHIETVSLPKEDIERVNRLLDIPSMEELSDEQMKEMGTEKDYYEGLFYVEFDDGSQLTFDLASGSTNYFDNAVWTSRDGRNEFVLDCSYELADVEFEVCGETYLVIIKEEEA